MPDLILDHVRDGIILLDINGRVKWMNPACETMLGWALSDIRGTNPQDLILPPEHRRTRKQTANFRYDFSTSLFDGYRITQHLRRDGSRFWNQQSHSLINLGPDDSQKMVVVTCRDVSDQVTTQAALHQVKDDLEHAAYHDDLTNLANRKRLSQYMHSNRVTAQIAAGRIGLLQLDLDKFKEINDTLGHAAGDMVLCHVADGLRQHARPDDLICRNGGDEFLLFCAETSNRTMLMARAEQVMRTINHPLVWKDQTITIGISIGAALSTSGTTSGEALIQQADHALYSAKDAGRGQVVYYTDQLGQRYRARQQLNRDLKQAVEQDQFTIFLQPMLDLAGNRITGCEALLRWKHPHRGLLAPASFLSAAEAIQLLPDIDYLSMNHALDALTQMRQAGFSDLTLSLNVSSTILSDVNYPGLLDWALQSRNLPHSSICVEILETSLLDVNNTRVMAAVAQLRRIGVRVALDDFGTGYAGLSHISTIEVDAIKLDHSMISRLESAPRHRVVTRSIIRLCALLGMDVVAEGVETQGQLDILRRAKCPFIQGFGLARPMPVPDMIDWLRTNTPLPAPLVLDAPVPTSAAPHKARQ
ncbi:putative bifunctional diguanylate cyclase/phosphodiesterase [Roseovarius pelagicus]|uniref:EAL domain-containing protein n=1 Tax=Roseovarius pelagicus TaxID=2980108 RepID=A0ABY6D8X2_9RHOB|nr:EAL domain-containing protein [Roseovarius pelagicus]UXX82523.1 EAL domain-containing protein [Roseovarius pelagicus]